MADMMKSEAQFLPSKDFNPLEAMLHVCLI